MAYWNSLCFGGELPEIEVKLSRAKSYLGRFELKYPTVRFLGRRIRVPFSNPSSIIRISTAFNLSEDQQDDVILHEMIHYWLYFKGLQDRRPHGPHFRAKMKELNTRFGRHLVIRYKAEQLK